MVFNTTFNYISVILWRSVLLMEETGVPVENQWPVASHWQTLSHNVVYLTLIEIRTHNICGDSIGSCKSNYCTITAMMTPKKIEYLFFKKKYGDVYNKLSKGTNLKWHENAFTKYWKMSQLIVVNIFYMILIIFIL